MEELRRLIERTRVDLIQMRNLNIDPDLYQESMGGGQGIGISRMIDILKKEFPSLQFGYFNRNEEVFHGIEDSELWNPDPFRKSELISDLYSICLLPHAYLFFLGDKTGDRFPLPPSSRFLPIRRIRNPLKSRRSSLGFKKYLGFLGPSLLRAF